MHNSDMTTKPVDIDALLNGYCERKRKTAASPQAEVVDYGLLCRYAAENVDAAERSRVEHLTESDPSIAELVLCLRAATQEEALAPMPDRPRKVPFVLTRLWHFPNRQLLRYAAVLLVLAGVTLLFFNRSSNKQTMIAPNDVQPPIAVIETRGIEAQPVVTNQPPSSLTNSALGANTTGNDGVCTNR